MVQERIEQKIFIIRGKKVMLDRDLAELYGVETKYIKRAVKRNAVRFPDDFMFILSAREYRDLRCHFGTLEKGVHSKYLPYAFTEHGILMLSSVLNSDKAIEVNIQIMRTFSKLRELMVVHKDLRLKIEEMEKKYDQQFKLVFNAIRKLLTPPDPPKKQKLPIGFHMIPDEQSKISARNRSGLRRTRY
jgi:phage regulator Rha-like protein